MKTVIIGGSAGGATVAARLRRLDEKSEIVILEKSADLSFATCAIPYYLGGVIDERDKLFTLTVEDFKTLLNVDVRTHCSALKVDTQNKWVTARDLTNNMLYKEPYDKLVIASGGQAVRPSVAGVNLPHVFAVRNASDMDDIKRFIDSRHCKNVVIVGGGYIGMEVADNLHSLGMNIAIVDRSDQVLNAWDKEMANIVQRHVEQKNVEILLNDSVCSIESRQVNLQSGKSIHADLVIIALGVQPNITLAQSAGLEIGEHGGVKVNSGLRTSDEHIYALGDVIEVTERLTKHNVLSPLASLAHKQARVVANNLQGFHDSFRQTQGTGIVKVFDLTVAITGSCEKYLLGKGIDYLKSYLEAPSHASYFPGSYPLYMKVLFAPRTGQLLGVQIVGSAGVDKRIDVFATAIAADMSVHDLVDLELAYTPPFSTSKDPVNLAGMVASNMMLSHYDAVHFDDIDLLRKQQALFVDVRIPEEYEIKTLPGAINIPLEQLRERLSELPQRKRIVLFCNYGKRGYFAYRIMDQHGYNHIHNLSGGLNMYIFAYGTQALTDYTDKPTSAGAASHDNSKQPALAPIAQAEQPLFSEFAKTVSNTTAEPQNYKLIEINACGLSCPGPIMKLSKTMHNAAMGDVIHITATDMGFLTDIKTWCDKKGHKLIDLQSDRAKIKAWVQKCKGASNQRRR
jgi:NADPH-dependent 2,4-dienoyl-CoA reductase/sulfur reductase-like enzyme/rhodanese-related sulfurtransferase/TusA-related sulfurtransferase